MRFTEGHHVHHWADGGETLDYDIAIRGLFQLRDQARCAEPSPLRS
jgi:hypothetical protein